MLLLGLRNRGGLFLRQFFGPSGLPGGEVGDLLGLIGHDRPELLRLLTHCTRPGGDQFAHWVARSRL